MGTSNGRAEAYIFEQEVYLQGASSLGIGMLLALRLEEDSDARGGGSWYCSALLFFRCLSSWDRPGWAFIWCGSPVFSCPHCREPSHTFCVHPRPRTQTQPAALTAAEESDPGIRRGGVQSAWPPSIAGFDSELLQRTTQKVSVVPG